MARKHYANAIVASQNIQFERWMDEHRKSSTTTVADERYVVRTAKEVLRKCDPKQYLLSHATIVASVDCYEPKDPKLGKRQERGVDVEVRWPNYRIKPECQSIINNNGDAWERGLLLSSYRTFIGAPNYLEHIQLPELSKGFIVDAIARDLGSTCYIDILVATDRKHEMLVRDILGGQIDSMSMGCISLFTVCNRCGNVAVDDSQLCPCIMYDGKGTKFFDEDGTEHILAELIGHVAVPNSNNFIEASWVRNPAFRGAMRRNILNPDSSAVAVQMADSAMVYELRRDVMNIDGILRAASQRIALEDEGAADEPAADEPADEADINDLGGEEPSDEPAGDLEADEPAGPDSGGDAPGAPPTSQIDDLVGKAQELLMEDLVKNLAERMAPKPEDVGTVTPAVSDVMSLNDNIIGATRSFRDSLATMYPHRPRLVSWASRVYKIVHGRGREGIVAAGLTPKDLIVLSWLEDSVRGRHYPADLYKVAMTVGSPKAYPSNTSFLAACSLAAGRRLQASETQFFTWKGKIASLSTNF